MSRRRFWYLTAISIKNRTVNLDKYDQASRVIQSYSKASIVSTKFGTMIFKKEFNIPDKGDEKLEILSSRSCPARLTIDMVIQECYKDVNDNIVFRQDSEGLIKGRRYIVYVENLAKSPEGIKNINRSSSSGKNISYQVFFDVKSRYQYLVNL